jgi:thiamine biosynthesis lipoprotein
MNPARLDCGESSPLWSHPFAAGGADGARISAVASDAAKAATCRRTPKRPVRPRTLPPRSRPSTLARERPVALFSRLRTGLRRIVLAGVVAGLPALASAVETTVFRHENVLGTSLELRVRADSAATARAAEARVLGEIERLSGIFSTYSPTSEFSRWQATRDRAVPVGGELFEVLASSDRWREASGGAFNPAVESLGRTWRAAARAGTPPTAEALAEARRAAAARAWLLNPGDRTATRLGDAPLTLNAIAKGWIVERAGKAALAADPEVRGLLLNVGGDLRHWGEAPERIDVADPRADGENAPAFTSIYLRDAALATSGNYRRNVRIGGRTYSHIVDPRSGEPADGVLSASVIAPDGATADALATTLSILDPAELRADAALLRGVDWMVVRANGEVLRSPGWAAREIGGDSPVTGGTSVREWARAEPKPKPGPRPGVPTVAAAATGAPNGQGAATGLWPSEYELRVHFELNQPEGGRYARPYVAIWVEDAEGFPVRTLTLWLLPGDKGLRWLSDLRRWSRSDQMRALVDPRNLVAAVSAATRPPGRYQTIWDGKDDSGQPVKRGRYSVFLEAAREHGTYQLIRQEVTVGDAPFQAELKGNIEIKAASLEYRQRPRTGAGSGSPSNPAPPGVR